MSGPAIPRFDVQPNDGLILIMGPSGTGKSTLINRIIGSPVAPCSSSFEPCTSEVKGYVVPRGNALYSRYSVQSRLIFVDTPGLDNDKFREVQVLKAIKTCLQGAVSQKAVVAGVIYLYYFWPGRMREEHRVDLDIFHSICGIGFWRRVVFGMTHGDPCAEEIRAMREEELRKKFWKEPLELGAQGFFLRDSDESAHALFGFLVPRITQEAPLIQILSDQSFIQRMKAWLATRLRRGLSRLTLKRLPL